jgi:hypothetical protein
MNEPIQRAELVSSPPSIDLGDLTAEEGELLVRLAGIIQSIDSGNVTLKLHDGHVTQLETAETIVLT